MAAWRAKAEALAENVEDAERERSVHLSSTLGGRFELSGSLDAATGAVVATALRVASSDDSDAEPARTPAERRADALGDVCRFFLDHQRRSTGGRHRPHLNVIVDVAALADGLGGETPDGTPLDGLTLSALLCDSAVHRLLMAGRSSVLDYGTSTRTIPAPLWNALVVRGRHCRFPGCDPYRGLVRGSPRPRRTRWPDLPRQPGAALLSPPPPPPPPGMARQAAPRRRLRDHRSRRRPPLHPSTGLPAAAVLSEAPAYWWSPSRGGSSRRTRVCDERMSGIDWRSSRTTSRRWSMSGARTRST